MRYFLIVGEASADLHASYLIRAIKAKDPEASFAFMGGDRMCESSGQIPIVHYREVAFMGIIPILRNFQKIRRIANLIQEEILNFKPDVVIPVDFAGFNFRYILPFVKKHLSCPVHYYIAPKLWAWRPRRIKTLRKYVDLLLCIFPFEVDYFTSRGVSSVYVGNPTVEETKHLYGNICNEQKQIALLPGSRVQELSSNLPLMLQSIRPYLSNGWDIVIAGAPGLEASDYHKFLTDYPEVQLHFGTTYTLIQRSRLALVTSGTASLEVALLGTPQIVLYRMGGQRLARWIFDHLFSVQYISLVNLILNRLAIPELIGAEVNIANVRSLLVGLLAETAIRKKQKAATHELRNVLKQKDNSYLTAETILDRLNNAN